MARASTPKTPEGKLRRFCILRAREHGHDVDWVRGIAHELFGVPSAEGLSLTVLDKPQLIRLADHIKTLTGGQPGIHRRGPRGKYERTRQHRDKTGAVIYLASAEKQSLIEQLAMQIWGSIARGGSFETFMLRMTGRHDIRMLPADQAEKLIEALMAMQQRGWKPRTAEGTR